MTKITVSSSIELEDHARWKAQGVPLAHVIRIGLMTLEKNPGYISRINELEHGNDKLQRKLTAVFEQLRELREESEVQYDD